MASPLRAFFGHSSLFVVWGGGNKNQTKLKISMQLLLCVHRMAKCEGNLVLLCRAESINALSEASINTINCSFGTKITLIEQLNRFVFLLFKFGSRALSHQLLCSVSLKVFCCLLHICF